MIGCYALDVFTLIKWALIGVFVAGFIVVGKTVPLGKHTLFGHIERIWKSDETQDLVEGTKEATAPTVDKVKRGVEAGAEAVRERAKESDAGEQPRRPEVTRGKAEKHPGAGARE